MKSLGFTEEELIAGFLCKRSQKSGKLFDLYRNRVIFPIIDTSGNIVAFGGRVMDGSEPKYLNSSDTNAFKKSRHLFALNYARKHCAERMILCEGYMDVIALHAAGFENAVATLGTAITSEQARIFAKYTKKVVICYDSDKAGQNAANKAMRLLGEVGVDVRVIKLNGAKDPDEYIKKFGADSFAKCLDDSKTGFEFKMDKILGEHDLSIPDEKIKASFEICSMIADVSNNVERDIYVQYAAKVLEVPVDTVRNDVGRIRNKRINEYKKKQSKDALLSIKNIGDRAGAEIAQLYVSAPESKIFKAPKELKGFKKVFLEPGEEKKVEIELSKRAFAYYNVNINDYHVESGEYKILVGASSKDIKLEEVIKVQSTVEAEVPDYSQSAPEYYGGDPATVSDASFEAVLGFSIPEGDRDMSLPITPADTLELAAGSKRGDKIISLITTAVEKIGGGGINSEMMRNTAFQIPIRCFITMSGGVVNDEMCEGICDLLNDKPLGKSFIKIGKNIPGALLKVPAMIKSM
jgi:DNA primase